MYLGVYFIERIYKDFVIAGTGTNCTGWIWWGCFWFLVRMVVQELV